MQTTSTQAATKSGKFIFCIGKGKEKPTNWTQCLKIIASLAIFLCIQVPSFSQENIRIFVSAPGQMVTDLSSVPSINVSEVNQEGFTSFTVPNSTWAPTPSGFTNPNIGTYLQSAGTSQVVEDNNFGAGTGNYLAISVGGRVVLTLNEESQYFGFAWAAGDGQNRIRVFKDGTQLFQFQTNDVTSFLPRVTPVTRTALDGTTTYQTDEWYGKPPTGTINSNEPYAFLHIISSAGLAFDSLVLEQISGGGFESDNHTVYFGPIPNVSELPGSWVQVTSRNASQAINDIASGNFRQPVTVNVLANDSDGGNPPLVPSSVRITGTSNPGDPLVVPGEGTWSVNTSTGAITFTPVASLIGNPTPITYRVADSGIPTIYSNEATVTVIYQETFPDFGTVNANTTLNGNVNTNDLVVAGTEYDGEVLTSGPVGGDGVLTLNLDGTYSFSASVPGVYLYTYDVCAPGATPPCPTETLQITVIDPNSSTNPPIANPDVANTLQNIAVIIDVLENDEPGNAGGALDPSSVSVTSGPANGSTSVNTTTGEITYTPNAAFTGVDTFTYEVDDTDNNGPTSTTVEVRVFPSGTINTVIGTDDYNTTFSRENATGNVLTNDSQLNNATALQATPETTTNAGGRLVLLADGSYTFTPALNFVGTTSFDYQVIGTNGASAIATLFITVNQGLETQPDVGTTLIGVPVSGNVSTNDIVASGTTYTYSSAGGGNPSGDVPTINPDGSYTFNPSAAGAYVFNVQVCAPTNPNPPCKNETLTITVSDPSSTTNPPIANNDLANTLADANPANSGVPVLIDVLENDRPGNPGGELDPSSVLVTSGPANGSISINNTTGEITYTPAAGFSGVDTFTYSIDDTDNNGPSTATVTINVYPAGTGNIVTAADDYASTNGITPVSGSVLTNDTQLSGAALTTVTNPGTYNNAGEGSLLLNANGTYTFTPAANFEGSTSFVYTAEGTDGATASATLHITVYPPLTFTWTGGDDDDWCNILNWSSGSIPVAGANIRIENTANPPVISNVCNVCINNLTIDSGASLTIPSGESVCVTGTLDSQGEVIDAGNIAMRGTTPQTIIGDFNISNLEIDNPTGATITSGAGNMVNITESLELTDGILTTNGNMTLKSDATGSAYLAPVLTCDGSVGLNGDVRVEVYVAGTNRSFRFFGHFFNHSISLQQIRDVIDITGDGLDFNDTGNPSAFWYNTTAGDQRSDVDAEDVGWTPFTSATLANWQEYQGIRVMVRGPKSQTGSLIDTDYVPDPVTFTWVGELNICEQEIRLTYSGFEDGGNAGDSRFNLIANPFPAPLDMGEVVAGDRNSVGSVFYVWEPRRPYASGATGFGPGGGRAGRYKAVPFTSADIQERTLPIGSAFFLESTDNSTEPAVNTNANITFRETYKLPTRTPGYAQPNAGSLFRQEELKSYYGSNSLQLLITEAENDLDRVIVYFKDESNAGRDYWDGDKMANDDMNFFTVSEDNRAQAVDSRPWLEGERFPLHILAPVGNYTMKIPDFDIEAGRKVQLHDRHLDELITLEKGATYEFEVTAEQASKGHRFDIVMGAEVITSIGQKAYRFQAFLLPNPAQQQVMVSIQRPDEVADTHVRLVDVRGVMLYETTLKATDDAQISYEVGGLAKGVYLVEITHGKQRIVKRLMVN